jgi:hypothetical protein
MKTTERMTVKRIYLNPTIELIKLDNEISLALESSPPAGPKEASLSTPEYFNNDPFKINIGRFFGIS